MGFSKQEYWSGLSLPSPWDLPNPGIKPGSPASQADSLPCEPPGKPLYPKTSHQNQGGLQNMLINWTSLGAPSWGFTVPYVKHNQWEFAIWRRELEGPCDNLRGGMGWEMGWRYRREGRYVYRWLIHVDEWQKPTQYYKAIILQLKMNKLKT